MDPWIEQDVHRVDRALALVRTNIKMITSLLKNLENRVSAIEADLQKQKEKGPYR